ncbi:MAG: sugar phosphate isomerase/epimerase [Candidatus Bathyarchaeia archaeon]
MEVGKTFHILIFMKLSLLIWFDNLNYLTPWIKKAKDIGYDAVELFPQYLSLREVSIVKKLLDEHKLEHISCVILPEEVDVASSNDRTRRNGVIFLEHCIDITVKLGGELVTGVIYAPWGKVESKSPKEDWYRSTASLKQVCKYASQFGVKLAIEPINHYRTYLVNTCEDAVKFLKDVGESNLGVHLDTYHMNIEENNFYEPVIAAGKRLYHVHCSESNRGMLGTGHVNWSEFFQALNEVDYQGYLGFEYHTPSIMRVSWKRVAPCMEEVAVRSLHFMKEMCSRYMRK